MKLFIGHPLNRNNNPSYLAADYAANSSIITVKNVAGFATNKFAILGLPGFEQAEIVRPTTINSPNQLVLAASTKFAHNADSKVTLLDYDQIKIYRSTTGISGSYTIQTTINITIDADTTAYEDATALSSYYYKITYYNSNVLQETDMSDPIAATGFVFHSLKTMVDRVLSLFGDSKAEFATRDEVTDYLNELYQRDEQQLAIATKRFNVLPQTITVANGTDEYPLNSDFLMEVAIVKSTDGGVTWSRPILMQQLDSLGDVRSTNSGEGYVIYNNTLKLKTIPQNSTDKYKVYYIVAPVLLINQTDTLIAPFIYASSNYVKYALGMLYLKDKKFDEWRLLTVEATTRSDAHLSFLKKLSSKHPQFMERTGEYFSA